MGTLTDCTLPTTGRRPYHRAPATGVDYLDDATLKERQSGSTRRCRQRRFYRECDPPVPADLAAHCGQADARLRAEIRARVAAGSSLVLSSEWAGLASATADPAPVAAA